MVDPLTVGDAVAELSGDPRRTVGAVLSVPQPDHLASPGNIPGMRVSNTRGQGPLDLAADGPQRSSCAAVSNVDKREGWFTLSASDVKDPGER